MSDIPQSLRECNQWICWRVETRDEETKVPVNPHTGSYASTKDSDTWTSYQEAKEAHQSSAIQTDGIGFVFTSDDPFCGIDLDETPIDKATEIIEKLQSYTEQSPSGISGNIGNFHIICEGFVPEGGNRDDLDSDSDAHIEMYDTARFFTVTGERSTIEATHTVENRAKEVYELHQQYIAEDTEPQSEAGGSGFDTSEGKGEDSENTTSETDLSNEDIISLAQSASNSDSFSRLWNGHTSGYESHSEADLALCNILAFYTGGDTHQMDELFRQSGLMRDKWDEQRGGQTYGEKTLSKAVEDTAETYSPATENHHPQPLKTVGDGGTEPATSTPTPTETDTEPQPEPEIQNSLCPPAVKLLAGLDLDESLDELTDRAKAAYVWKLIKETDTFHVRLTRETQELWAFDSSTRTWKPDGERTLKQAARKALDPVHYGGNVFEELKNQVEDDPEAEVYRDTFGIEAGKLPVKNGLLDLQTAYENLTSGTSKQALRDLKPTDYALSQLDVEYQPDADNTTWYNFIGDTVETSKIQTLQEYIGHCLHRENLFERALLLVGSGENGKSTFLNAIERFLGEDNTTSVSPFDFGDKPALAQMEGKLANISVELDGASLKGKSLSNFKKLTGGDTLQGKRLYQDPFDFQYNGGMLFATNEVPTVPVDDDDTAFWRRWIIVHFDNQFPEGSDKRDPTLGKRLTEPENLSAILNWAIEGWGRLRENSEFDNVPATPDTTRQKWQSWGDSVEYFFSNIAERDTEATTISTSEAWEYYRHWCYENGHDAVGQSTFTNRAKKANLGYVGSGSSVRSLRKGTPTRGYRAFGTVDGEPNPEAILTEDSDSDSDGDGDGDGVDSEGVGLNEFEEQPAIEAGGSGFDTSEGKGEDSENTNSINRENVTDRRKRLAVAFDSVANVTGSNSNRDGDGDGDGDDHKAFVEKTALVTELSTWYESDTAGELIADAVSDGWLIKATATQYYRGDLPAVR